MYGSNRVLIACVPHRPRGGAALCVPFFSHIAPGDFTKSIPKTELDIGWIEVGYLDLSWEGFQLDRIGDSGWLPGIGRGECARAARGAHCRVGFRNSGLLRNMHRVFH